MILIVDSSTFNRPEMCFLVSAMIGPTPFYGGRRVKYKGGGRREKWLLEKWIMEKWIIEVAMFIFHFLA